MSKQTPIVSHAPAQQSLRPTSSLPTGQPPNPRLQLKMIPRPEGRSPEHPLSPTFSDYKVGLGVSYGFG